jgi:pimeloyl-ACP methyl ester carboxylesterase
MTVKASWSGRFGLSLLLVLGLFVSAGAGTSVAVASKKKAKKPTTTRTKKKTPSPKASTTSTVVVASVAGTSLLPTPTIATAVPATVPATVSATVPALASTIVWAVCGEYDCATVNVPLDYSAPAGPQIAIALKRRRAVGPNPIGSVLINPGGPSGSGIDFLTNRPKLFSPPAREKYHVIGFDPRGVGQSAPLSCASTRDRSARTSKDYVDAVRDACYNRQPDLVKAITTANTARDMEQIRIALGETKLNYLGVSYGTYLGMVYADLFPDRVGRFMIDSAVDPSLRAIELTAGQYGVYEARVVDFLGRCSRSRTCTFGPNSLQRYDSLLKQLETQPLRANGLTVDRASMESITFAMIRAGLETTLARFLSEFERSNASSLPELQRIFNSALPNINDLVNDADGDGMYYQVACAEGFHPSASVDSPEQKLAVLTANAPRFVASAAGIANSKACVYWGQQNDSRPQPTAKPGLPPLLFFGSVNDNVTPAVWTKRAASQWPGSVYVQVSGAAHGVMSNNACANEVGSIFLLSGLLPDPAVCSTP